MNFFYSHLIEIESIIDELNNMELFEDQKHHLATLIDSTFHYTILDLILSNLSDGDKRQFLHQLRVNPEDEKLMKFLNKKIEGIERRVQEAAAALKEELYQDLKEAKRYG